MASIIIESPSAQISAKVRSAISAAYSVNRAFFDFKPKNPIRVILCTSRQQWRRECREYFHPRAVGVVLRDGTLVVKSSTLCRLKWFKYKRVLRHEMNHAFWVQLMGPPNVWSPFWLLEGLACYIGRDAFLKSARTTLRQAKKAGWDHRIVCYRYNSRYLTTKQAIKLLYSLWFHFLRFLAGNDQNQIRAFVIKVSKNRNRGAYEQVFKSFWGMSTKVAFAHFLVDYR